MALEDLDQPLDAISLLQSSVRLPATKHAITEAAKMKSQQMLEPDTDVPFFNSTRPAGAPSKNKQILLILEMIPFFGPLGIDRFYLGNNYLLASFKLVVCLLTCCIGGIAWGLVDAIAVVVNAFQRYPYINSLGMEATFDNPGQVEGAHTLAVFVILIQIVFCCCGCTCISLCFRHFWQRVRKNSEEMYVGNPPASRVILN